MTYAILSTTSGHLLESYRTEDRALEAAARIHATEPEAMANVALVTFDDMAPRSQVWTGGSSVSASKSSTSTTPHTSRGASERRQRS
jgi:hypothetical protein